MKKKLAFCIASLFGVGYAPVASGTFGSLVTIPVAVFLCYYWGTLGVLIAVLLSTILGTIATAEVLKYTKHDPSLVVIDEFAGQMLSFYLVAPYCFGVLNVKTAMLYAGGFALFRLFDITKPWLVGWADKKILNAFGVMLDDLFAGLFAAICLFALFYCLK